MGILDRLFGKSKKGQIKYMELPRPDGDYGLCSDDECPCGPLGVPIPRGEGYIYISHHVVDFREDCLTVRKAHNKIQRTVNGMGGGAYTASPGVFAPILVCEKGAKKRKLNLKIAAADARHWWETGLVPLRPTPKARKKTPDRKYKGEETALKKIKAKKKVPFGKEGKNLITAAEEGDTETVEMLLTKGADVNAEDEGGGTALMSAAWKGHTETVEMLLTKGADVNAKDEVGCTALMDAALYAHTEIVEMLLTKGADVNAKTEGGGTALMEAAEEGHTETVEMLLTKGADVNAEDEGGGTALTAAAREGHTETVRLLKQAGARE